MWSWKQLYTWIKWFSYMLTITSIMPIFNVLGTVNCLVIFLLNNVPDIVAQWNQFDKTRRLNTEGNMILKILGQLLLCHMIQLPLGLPFIQVQNLNKWNGIGLRPYKKWVGMTEPSLLITSGFFMDNMNLLCVSPDIHSKPAFIPPIYLPVLVVVLLIRILDFVFSPHHIRAVFMHHTLSPWAACW